MKKRIALLLTGVMLLGLLSGCNTYQSDDSASSAGSTSNTADEVSADFTMAYNGVVTLNPIMSQSSNDFNLFYLTQIQLVRFTAMSCSTTPPRATRSAMTIPSTPSTCGTA